MTVSHDAIRADDTIGDDAAALRDATLPATTTGSWKELLLAAIALAIIAQIIFWPLATHPTEMLVGPQRKGLNDLNAYYIYSRQFPLEMMQRFGEFPFWNPYSSFGKSYVGNPQSALYYPPNWICFFIESSIALSWLMVAHHWWAGLGVYVLVRMMGCRFSSALFAGAAALAGPYWIAHMGEGHYAQVCAVSWAPWALLAFGLIRSAHRFGIMAMVSVLAMSFFCDHVQETFYLVLMLSGCLLADAVSLMWNKRRADAFGLVGRWTAVGLLTAGLVSIDLIPSMAYTRSTIRAVIRDAELQVSSDRFLTQNYSQLLDPYVLGAPKNYEVQGTPYCEMSLYLGIIPAVLAGVGIVGFRRAPGVTMLTVLLAFTFLFALGRDGPLYSLMYSFVPGIAWFRAQARILFYTQLLLSILAGLGVEWIARRSSNDSLDTAVDGKSIYRLPLYAAVVYALSATLMIYFLIPAELQKSSVLLLKTIWQRPMLWVCLFSPAMLAATMRMLNLGTLSRHKPLLTTCGFTLLLLIETTLFARETLVTVKPVPLDIETASTSNSPVTTEAAVRFGDLSQLAADQGENGSYPRVVSLHSLLSEHRSCELGIHRLRGYDPILLTNYMLAILHLRPIGSDLIENMGFLAIDLTTVRQNLLSLYGVRYAIVPRNSPHAMPDGWIHRGVGEIPAPIIPRERPASKRNGTDHAANEPLFLGYQVWENPHALPRAFVVGHAEISANLKRTAETVDDPSKRLDAQLEAFDPRQAVILQTDDVLPPGPRSDYRPAVVTAYTPNRVAVAVELEHPGYLVLTDLYHPGWTATDNGQPVKILLGDIGFRAIPLAAGRHEIEFRYQTVGFSQGRILTLSSLLVLMLLVVKRRRK
ncbi:MAG: YfhO family protein [Planctomycetaceae bacterium]